MSDPRKPPAEPPPDASARQHLLDTLRELERDPSGAAHARSHLRDWLSEEHELPPGPHIDLQDLQVLSAVRQREPSTFHLPDHLLECKVCMELFQVLCSAPPRPQTTPTGDAGHIIAARPSPSPPATRRRPALRVYASLAAAVLLGLLLWTYSLPPGIILETGALQGKGDTLRGGRLPARSNLEALQRTRLRFLDGSSIELEPGTRIRVGKTLRFQTLLLLDAGQGVFDFRGADSAPSLRIDNLHILPASATFQINRSTHAVTLSVHRGELQLRQGSETRRLREGETALFE